MASVFQVRLKAAALENLKQSRERVRTHLGTAQVGARLSSLSEAEAGELANALLDLMDQVDSVLARAKPAD